MGADIMWACDHSDSSQDGTCIIHSTGQARTCECIGPISHAKTNAPRVPLVSKSAFPALGVSLYMVEVQSDQVQIAPRTDYTIMLVFIEPCDL